MKRWTLTLWFDPESFEDETGRPLTKDQMEITGHSISNDAVFYCGYEGWKVEEVEVDETEH